MKKLMKKLSVVLIVVGLIMISLPIVGQWTTNYLETTMISAWQNGKNIEDNKLYQTISSVYNVVVDLFNADKWTEDSFTAELEEQNQLSTELGEGDIDPESIPVQQTYATPKSATGSTVKNPTSTSKPKTSVKKKSQQVIGIIKIPKIDISLPIVEGIKKQDLRVGIGHFPDSAPLGAEGNSALAGHRSYAMGKMFNRLNEVESGDKVTILTKKGTFVYEVYQKLVVLPKEVYVLANVKNDSIITLVTCTPVRVATHRLIVKARLVK